MVFAHVTMLHVGSGMSPANEDTVRMLGEFVAATAPRPPPPPPFKGYDPVFEAHYPKFYKSLTGATKPGEGYTYLNDQPKLLGSLSQDCKSAGARPYCYGVTRATMVKNGLGSIDAAKSTAYIFG